jgi:hypothetical protein
MYEDLHFKDPEAEKKEQRRALLRHIGGVALAAAILAMPTKVEANTPKQAYYGAEVDTDGNPLIPGAIYVDPTTGIPYPAPLPGVKANKKTKLGIQPGLNIPTSTPTPTPEVTPTITPTPTATPTPSPTPEISPTPEADPTLGIDLGIDLPAVDPLVQVTETPASDDILAAAPATTPEATPTTTEASTGLPPLVIPTIPTSIPEAPQLDPLDGAPVDNPLTIPVDPTQTILDSLLTKPEDLDVEANDFPTDTEEILTEGEGDILGPLGPDGTPLTPEEIPIFAYKWNGQVLDSYLGHVDGPTGDETYYNLPMGGVVKIMRNMGNQDKYWVREDGVKMLGKYVMVAADLKVHPRGSIVQTTLGPGRVCDTGLFAKTHHQRLDIAVDW